MSRIEDGDVKTIATQKTEKPPMYKVVLHNDDYTPMDLVTDILINIFKHSQASATRIMLKIHKSGVGIAGVYSKEIAETKMEKAIKEARKNESPLQVTMEQE